MVHQFILNILLALIWTLLQDRFTLLDLTVGYLLGLVAIHHLARFYDEEPYSLHLWGAVRLFAVFLWEVVLANITVVRQIMAPQLTLQPGIIAVPLQLEDELLITLYAAMISMTPGTLSVDLSEDHKVLYIHLLDADDPRELRARLHDLYEAPLLELMR